VWNTKIWSGCWGAVVLDLKAFSSMNSCLTGVSIVSSSVNAINLHLNLNSDIAKMLSIEYQQRILALLHCWYCRCFKSVSELECWLKWNLMVFCISKCGRSEQRQGADLGEEIWDNYWHCRRFSLPSYELQYQNHSQRYKGQQYIVRFKASR